ncbi:MAG: SBBP repeat-containing protein [Caldilineaceae bacterium]
MKIQSLTQKLAAGLFALGLFAGSVAMNPAPVKAAEPDPTIIYSTFVGEISSDYIRDTALDSQGNLYVAGYTYSKNLGGSSNPVKGYSDAFVGKLNPDGSAWQWITYIGGNQSEEGYALVVGKDAVWVTGYTDSPDYPTTANAQQRTFGGYYDVLLARLDPATGAVNYSTYYGHDMRDEGRDLALDAQGNVYVTGINNSGNVLALKVTGEANPKVVYEVQWGDDWGQDIGYGIAVDKVGHAYITGMTENSPSGTTFPIKPGALQSKCGPYTYSNGESSCTTDAFLSILNAEGTELLYSSLLGGSGGPELSSGSDEARAIALDAQGNIYLTGMSYAADFPTVNAAYPNYPDATNMADVWVTKLTPNGKTILYSTYLGGDSDDEGSSITTDGKGNAYVLSQSRSTDFPTLKALQSNLGKGGICFSGSTVRACYDNAITKLSPTGAVRWSTYLGHGFDEFGYGITRDQAGSIYVVGNTESPEYPTTNGAIQRQWGGNEDGFITQLSEGGEDVPGGTVSLFLPLVER